MPNKKKEVQTSINEVTNSTSKLVLGSPFVDLLSLNLDLGRQDLNDNFKKVEDKINELIRKQ